MPPHSSGCSPSAASSARTRSGFASGHVDLVDGDDDRDAGRARRGEIDSFVCGITPSSAATTRTAMSVTFAPRARMAVNASWPGVSRNVIFRPSMLGLVGADVLGDPAGLGLDDRGLADRVEQRRLAVVDVAHDRDDRRARREILLGVLEDLRQLLVVGGVLDRDLALQLGRRSARPPRRTSDCVICDHLAEAHHDLDDAARPGRRAPARGRGRRRPTERSPGRSAARLLLLALGRRVRCGRGCWRALGRSVAALDHDPALAPGRACRGPDRAVRLVRFVSHQRSV